MTRVAYIDNPKHFAAIFKAAAIACKSKNREVCPPLEGVHLHLDTEGHLVIQGTDSFVVFEGTIDTFEVGGVLDIVIPFDTVKIIVADKTLARAAGVSFDTNNEGVLSITAGDCCWIVHNAGIYPKIVASLWPNPEASPSETTCLSLARLVKLTSIGKALGSDRLTLRSGPAYDKPVAVSFGGYGSECRAMVMPW